MCSIPATYEHYDPDTKIRNNRIYRIEEEEEEEYISFIRIMKRKEFHVLRSL
jgi:hypothetical protein